MPQKINVLIVEDTPDDAELMVLQLREAGYQPEWQRVENETDYLSALEHQLDLILADWSLPQFSGLRALQLMSQRNMDIPFIIVSGSIGEETAIDAIRQGAYDYLLKDRPGRLGSAIHRALEEKRLREERQQADLLLRESEETYRQLFEAESDALFLIDNATGKILQANRATSLMYGYDQAELLALKNSDLSAEPEQTQRVTQESVPDPDQVVVVPLRWHKKKNGQIFPVEISARFFIRDGRAVHIAAVRDITQRLQAEEQLRLNEERYRNISDMISDYAYAYRVEEDQTLVLEWVTRGFERITGFNPTELDERGGWSSLIYPDDMTIAKVRADKLFAGKQDISEFRIVGKNGEIRWLRDYSRPVWDDRLERVARIFGAVEDITLRKQAETDSRRRAEVLVTVNEIGKLLAETLTLPTLYTRLTQAIYDLLPDICGLFISLYNPEKELIHCVCGSFDQQFVDPAELPPLALDCTGKGRQSQVILSGEALIVDDLEGGPKTSIRVLVGDPERLAQSALYVPMQVEGKVIGLLQIQSYTLGRFTEQDVQLLTLVANTAAVAISNAHLFQQTQERLEELNALHRASQVLLTTRLDVQTTYAAVHQAAAQVMPCEAFVIVLADERDGDYQAVYLFDKGGAYPPQRLPAGEGLSGRVIQAGASLLIPDYSPKAGHPGVHFGDPEHVRSVLAVPLQRGEKIIGMVSAQSYRPDAYRENHKALLETLAAQFASAIENANLYAQVEARLHELEVLAAISAALREAPTRSDMLPVILDELIRLLNVDAALVEVQDSLTGEVLTELGRGDWENVTGQQLPAGTGLSAHILATGKAYLSNDVRGDPHLYRPQLFKEFNAAAGAPMVVDRQLQGLLWIGSRRHLRDDDQRLLGAVADMAANALRRAALHDQTEQRLQQLTALHRIEHTISGSFDLNLILKVIVEQAAMQLHADAAAVLLLEPVSLTLQYTAGYGFQTSNIQRTQIRLGHGQAGEAAFDRRSLGIADLSDRDEDFAVSSLIIEEGFVSHYVTPLVFKGKLKGVLEIYNRSRLDATPHWLEFFETLAGQAAVAIDNAAMFDELQSANLELSLAYDATIEGWSQALDLRDKETEGHSQRVTELTLQLARMMGMEEDQLIQVRRGALLHDIGKLGVPDSILLKPGKLNEDEWEIMHRHPKLAYEMLSMVKYLRPALDIPLSHHEKWDGSGYPDGLKGEQIPLPARIFAVIDVYDALIHDRPYRSAWEKSKALEYIQEQAGKHFDPQVVEIFLRMNLYEQID